MDRNQNSKFFEKYKPDDWLYVVIMLVFAVIRFVSISCGYSDVDEALNDLAVGAIASTIVAWLIDIADCRKKNADFARKERMVFAEYCSAVNEMGNFIARRCKNFSQPTDVLNIGEWLDKLSDTSNYSLGISPAATMDRAYFHIASYVRNVKFSLLSLRQQYCMLVESDIIETDDFRQHITEQVRICDEICDALALVNYKNCGLVKDDVNNNLILLESNARNYFPEQIQKTYSWECKG